MGGWGMEVKECLCMRGGGGEEINREQTENILIAIEMRMK